MSEQMTESTATSAHPGWCDPTWCQHDALQVGDREHVHYGGAIALSLHDRVPLAGGRDCRAQFVAVFVNRHVSDAAPTVGLHSETVGNDSRPGPGFELRMTRAELVALHAEITRIIEATG